MLQNKIILLTGATDGIGRETAFLLAQNRANLILHGKNLEKGKALEKELIKKTKNPNISYFNADFTSFDEIKKLSDAVHKQYSHIDILINNAGIFETQKIILDNGIEKNFMVNHLAPFALTLHLLDLLEKSVAAKIINLSSMIHADSIDFENLNAEKYYSGAHAYSLSKLCNVLFTYTLDDRLKGKKITVNALHPGVINTKLLRAGWGAMGDAVKEAAKRIFYLTQLENSSGQYYVNNRSMKSTAISYDKSVQEKLWEISTKYMETNDK